MRGPTWRLLNHPESADKPESLIRYVKDRPGHDRRYAIDPTKIETELGWKPKYNFDTGIRQTIDWYLNNQDWWKHILSGEYSQYFEKCMEIDYNESISDRR